MVAWRRGAGILSPLPGCKAGLGGVWSPRFPGATFLLLWGKLLLICFVCLEIQGPVLSLLRDGDGFRGPGHQAWFILNVQILFVKSMIDFFIIIKSQYIIQISVVCLSDGEWHGMGSSPDD